MARVIDQRLAAFENAPKEENGKTPLLPRLIRLAQRTKMTGKEIMATAVVCLNGSELFEFGYSRGYLETVKKLMFYCEMNYVEVMNFFQSDRLYVKDK
jgi:hypothetical protein